VFHEFECGRRLEFVFASESSDRISIRFNKTARACHSRARARHRTCRDVRRPDSMRRRQLSRVMGVLPDYCKALGLRRFNMTEASRRPISDMSTGISVKRSPVHRTNASSCCVRRVQWYRASAAPIRMLLQWSCPTAALRTAAWMYALLRVAGPMSDAAVSLSQLWWCAPSAHRPRSLRTSRLPSQVTPPLRATARPQSRAVHSPVSTFHRVRVSRMAVLMPHCAVVTRDITRRLPPDRRSLSSPGHSDPHPWSLLASV
jgi:hypothetical protein